MNIIKKIAVALLIVLVLIQFYRPEKNNAEYRDINAFLEDTKPNKNVQAILSKNCYDCHSNKTSYPWYSNVAPVSFWLDHHVEEGNEHFNLSNWANYSVKERDHKLDELIEEVEEGEMPLQSYTILHGALNDNDKEALIHWAKQARKNYDLIEK